MPVRLTSGTDSEIHLMLAGKKAAFGFWELDEIRQTHPRIAALLLANDPAGAHYDQLKNDPAPEKRRGLATILNVLTAIDEIPNPGGAPLLEMYSSIVWDCTKPDRFYARVPPGLQKRLSEFSEAKRDFVSADSLLHFAAGCAEIVPGGRKSFKQTVCQEANVQFTFHRSADPAVEIVENDMDYFEDIAAHMLLEVIPNELSRAVPGHRRLTDPRQTFLLRWMQERNGKKTRGQFNPPFDLV